ncbi:PH domain-containing protein [Bacillus sp. OV194]|nr:PH domain-containing protein [Bacillus sp. OV194]
MKFKSKKDWWLSLIVWGAIIATMGTGVYVPISETARIPEFVLLLVATIGIPGFILWMWLTTCYVVDETHLVIRFGPFKQVISLDTVKSVKKTMNPISSPALSLKRLEIMYDKYDMVLISPMDRNRFIEVLSQKCPNMENR